LQLEVSLTLDAGGDIGAGGEHAVYAILNGAFGAWKHKHTRARLD